MLPLSAVSKVQTLAFVWVGDVNKVELEKVKKHDRFVYTETS